MAFNAGDIETTLGMDRTPFNQGLDKAEKDARAFEKKRFKAKVDIDVDRDRVDQALDKVSKTKPPKVHVEADVDTDQIEKKLDEVAKNTEKTANRSGNRFARALLNPVMIQLGLLPAAAAIAVAAVGAVMALPVLGFGAWGAAALKGNQEVRNAFGGLKDEVIRDSKEMAQALQPALVGVAQEANVAWRGLKPEFQRMFQDAAPLVTEFSDGLVQLGINAIPGISLALERGGPAIKGWNSLLSLTGTGISDMFDNASRHTAGAQTGLAELGVTIQHLLGFVGSLVGVFSDAWAMIGGQFNGALEQALDFVLSFAEGALPAMGGGLQGILLILQGVMSVLGPFADIFGMMTGSVLGAVAAYKLLSMATSGIGKGFNAAKTAVASATTKLAEGGTAIGLWGDRSKKAADDVDRTTSSTSRLGGAMSKVSSVFQKVGNSLPIIGAAFVLLDSVFTEITKTSEDKMDELDSNMDKARARIERRFDDIRDASKQSADALLFWNKAAQTYGTQSEQAAIAQDTLARSTLAEKDAQNRAAEATKTHTERLLDFFDALTGGLNKQVAYNNTVKDLKEKQDELAKAIKEHGKGSMEAKFATDEFSLAMANQVKAAGDLALANASGKNEYDKLVDVQKATALEAIKLIDIFGSQAPPALYKTVAAMSDAELKAIGGKREFDSMGNAIIKVPEYKPIKIDSNMAQEAQNALTLKNRVNELPTGDKFLRYFIQTVTTPGPVPTAPFPIPGQGHASGTEFFRGGRSFGFTKLNESGPEVAQLPDGTKIFAAQRSRDLVRDEVSRALAASPRGGGGVTVHNTINPPPMADYDWLDLINREITRSLEQRARTGG